MGYLDREMQLRQLSLYEGEFETDDTEGEGGLLRQRKNCITVWEFSAVQCLRFCFGRRMKSGGRGRGMEVTIIFKIAAVGILVSILSQVLKHSGRDEQAFMVSLAGLLIVLFWIVPYIYELFQSIQKLFVI